MPWTVNDADRFKKGLSDKGKRQWAAVANSALAQCQRENGKDCEARAIRTANGSVKESDPLTQPQPIIIRENRISDFTQDLVIEENDENGAGTKREVLVTLLKEGPGNSYHKNYYSKRALESTLTLLKTRPKQYFNHAPDVDNADRDIRDWASSIKEAWIENDKESGRAKLKARVKVFDNWLWERAKMAPEQLAVSIEGRGTGKPEMIDGVEFNAIEEINQLNGVNWVDYPGNADMGVQVAESNKSKPSQEDKQMLTHELLDHLKSLSADELKEVASTRPELKEFFVLPVGGNDEQLAKLSEQVAALKSASESQAKALSEKVAILEKENARMTNQVEAYQIKDKGREKEQLVESMLKSSKLKQEHVTETFKAQLLKVEEMKIGDKIIAEQDQIKQLIDDREKICVAETAKPNQPGESTGGEVPVEEQHRLFCLNIFGIDPEKTEKKKEEESEGK